MPHVTLRPGKSEQPKKELAEEITKARRPVMKMLNYGEESVCVGIAEVSSQNWTDKVYKPDMLGKARTIHKKKGIGSVVTESNPQRAMDQER